MNNIRTTYQPGTTEKRENRGSPEILRRIPVPYDRAMELDRLNDAIAALHGGKKWMILRDAAAGVTGVVEHLRGWGAVGVIVVAAIEGVGDLPAADRLFYTRASGDTVMH